MLHLKNFRTYTPEDPWLGRVVYLQDEDGNDWYDVQSAFQADTIKVFYDPEEGQVCAALFDVTSQTPEGLSIVELPADAVPSHVSIDPDKKWVYQDGIVSRVLSQYNVEARALRNEFLKATDALMVPDYTISDELLSDDERRQAAKIRVSFKSWPKTEGWPMVALPDVPDWMMREAQKNGFINKTWPE